MIAKPFQIALLLVLAELTQAARIRSKEDEATEAATETVVVTDSAEGTLEGNEGESSYHDYNSGSTYGGDYGKTTYDTTSYGDDYGSNYGDSYTKSSYGGDSYKKSCYGGDSYGRDYNTYEDDYNTYGDSYGKTNYDTTSYGGYGGYRDSYNTGYRPQQYTSIYDDYMRGHN